MIFNLFAVSAVYRPCAKLRFNGKESVVFCDPFTPAGSAGFDISGVCGDCYIRDRRVTGLAAPVRDDRAVRAFAGYPYDLHGFGKRSEVGEYRLTARGAKGVRTIDITEKTGKLVTIKNVTEDNDLMIITKSGLTIRMAVADIRVCGRATQGVKLINLREGDSIAAVSVVAHEDSQEAEDAAPETTTEQ